jgi:hypothetical protein
VDIVTFVEARLADDERFVRVLTEAGERKAENLTHWDVADVLGLMNFVMSVPEARAELARWHEGGVMPPTTTERVLADIAVKRALVTAYRGSAGPAWEALHGLLMTLAASWSAHPDYDLSWTISSLS